MNENEMEEDYGEKIKIIFESLDDYVKKRLILAIYIYITELLTP